MVGEENGKSNISIHLFGHLAYQLFRRFRFKITLKKQGSAFEPLLCALSKARGESLYMYTHDEKGPPSFLIRNTESVHLRYL